MFRIRNFSRTKTWVKLTVLGVSLALVGYLVWSFVITPWVWCGPDVRRIDDQCIGVTDGWVALNDNPDLTGVLGKIWQENERVERKDPGAAVSVAYLVPLPKELSDENRAATIG